jgi:hypothetical protein
MAYLLLSLFEEPCAVALLMPGRSDSALCIGNFIKCTSVDHRRSRDVINCNEGRELLKSAIKTQRPTKRFGSVNKDRCEDSTLSGR